MSADRQEGLRKRERFVFGVLLPVAIMVVGMLGIANVESRASAAEFAALAVFFMLLVALPITLVVNAAVMLQKAESVRQCFIRGMVLPGIVMLAAVVYQSGLWDALT